MAEGLYAAGARTEARSCLLLSARKGSTDVVGRTRLLGRLVRLELESEAQFEEVAGELRNLVHALVPADHEGLQEFAALVSEFGPEDADSWQAFLQSIESQPGNRLTAAIGLAALQGIDPGRVDRLFELIEDDDRETSRARHRRPDH